MKSKSDKLLKNTLIYTIGNLGSKLLSFILVPLYSFYLAKSELGYFDLVITSVSLIVPFVTVQIAEATYRWLLETKSLEKEVKKAVTNGLFVLIINAAVFFIVYLAASTFVSIKYGLLCYGIVFLISLYGFFTQSARGIGLNKLYATIGILNTLLVVLSNVSFFLLDKMTVETLLYSIVIANFLSVIVVFLKAGFHKLIDLSLVSRSEIADMVKYSWPLIPNAISWWLINEVNKFIILFYLGSDENGIFAISNRFPAIILILNTIFMMSWQDLAIVNDDTKDKDEFYSKVFNSYVALELSVVICLTSVCQLMVKHLVGPDFFSAWQYMPFLYLSVAFSAFSAFLGVGYLGSKQTGNIFTTTICGSIVNVLVTVSLINQLGLYAPALGAFLGFMTIFFIRLNSKRSSFKIQVDWLQFLTLMALAGLSVAASFVDNIFVQGIHILTAVVVFVGFNRKLLTYFYRYAMGFVDRNTLSSS